MRVLIAGCGFVGGALARRLVSDGHEVFGLRRRPGGTLPRGVAPVTADLAARRERHDVPGDLDWCVTAISPDARTPDAYDAAYMRATRNLQSLLEAESPALDRWIFTSSTAVYGQESGEWVDEDSSTEPSGFTGRALLAGERIVRQSGVPHPVVVRLGGIYGPGRARLLDRVRAGEADCPPEPTFTNRIHRDDAAGVLHHLLPRRRRRRSTSASTPTPPSGARCSPGWPTGSGRPTRAPANRRPVATSAPAVPDWSPRGTRSATRRSGRATRR